VTLLHDVWHLATVARRRTMTADTTTNRRAVTAVTTSISSIRTRTRTRSSLRANLRFAGHFLEMVVAMFVGMAALAPVWSYAAPGLVEQPAVHAMIMATNMTVGMALWMWIRRHPWPRIAEMSAAMYLPFVVLLVPYWLGAISADALMTGGHLLMLPAMLGAMLWRRTEYSHSHHRHK
jgi:flagellar biosynthetic protein FliP